MAQDTPTVEAAQQQMDLAVAQKAQGLREYDVAKYVVDVALDTALAAARKKHGEDVEHFKATKQASLKTWHAAIAKAGALVRRASQAESREKAEAKAMVAANEGRAEAKAAEAKPADPDGLEGIKP